LFPGAILSGVTAKKAAALVLAVTWKSAIGRICLISDANIHEERETPDRTLSLA